MKLLKRLSRLYWHYWADAEREARHLGVNIGEKCLIATRNWSSEPYLITIGNNVQIAGDVWFFNHGGGNCIRKDHPDFEAFGKIRIEDWVYIGSCSCILPGVTIGEGALVSAGSVVTKSVPPHSVVAGNPARVICLTEDYYARNEEYDIGKRISENEKRRLLLSLPESKFIAK